MSTGNVQWVQVAIKDLLFDPDNPRLPPEVDKTRQESILEHLVLQIGVEDVLTSIAATGFVAGDPVIVKPAQRQGQYYVIEGNRRLAALKLLNGERVQRGPKVPELDDEAKAKLKQIEVQKGWAADDLVAYLGYKHVTAAKEWGPEAKARFVVSHTNNDFTDDALRKFASELGTKLGTLKRWLVAHFAIEQAIRKDLVDKDLISDQLVFGTFYTLLGSKSVKEFVGLEPEENLKEPIKNQEEFAEFLSWVIAPQGTRPVINSRDQTELSRVLANEEALEYFRRHKDLKSALRYVRATGDEVAQVLRQARFLIDNVLSAVADQREYEKVGQEFAQLERSIANTKKLLELSNG